MKSRMADMMSHYRYAGNEKISLSDVRKIRMDSVLGQCSDTTATLLINDVSLLDYCYHDSKGDRRDIGDGKGKGYEYVCNLAVSLEDERPLGVIHDCLISAEGPDDSNVINYHADKTFDKLRAENRRRLECNHKHQLVCHSRYIRKQAGNKSFIMVADREFDDHFFFEECVPGKFDCVIRSNALRNVQTSADYNWIPDKAKTGKYNGLPKMEGFIFADMKELVKHVPTSDYKMLPLDGKGRHTDPESAKSWAELSIGAFEVILYRDVKRNRTYFSPKKYVRLNVVVIKEENPPSDREAICWILFTTLSIKTIEDLNKIGRIYELRWLIECFFKYLKSGYKVEELRYDNAEKTAKIMVSITLASSFLFSLKHDLGIPMKSLLDREDYDNLKRAAKNLNDNKIDFKLRLFAFIATQGGWLGRRADPISPMILMRGYAKVEFLINSSSLLKDEFLNNFTKWSIEGTGKNAYNR